MKLQFDEFTLDSGTRQLAGKAGDVRLSPKAFDLLCLLAERRPEVVPKPELHARIWPDTHVVDANLNVLVGEVRSALGDSPSQPRFIRTVNRVGYAFCAEATETPGARDARPAGNARYWLVWNERTFVLPPGETIIGRDPSCAIWLDVSGVSRRHARVHVAADWRVVIEDLGSTNGTFIGEEAVSGPTPLKDNDLIHAGSVALTFRTWSAERSVKTARIPRR